MSGFYTLIVLLLSYEWVWSVSLPRGAVMLSVNVAFPDHTN